MTLLSQSQLENTLSKLDRLEARYEALRDNPTENERLGQLSMTSIKRLINQLQEEVGRFRAGVANGRGRHGELCDEQEVANTRKKLQGLEVHYSEICGDNCMQPDLRDAVRTSLKRMINQLKEEIAWFEAHHPVRPPTNEQADAAN